VRSLYPDQIQILDEARARFRGGARSVLLLAPTGFGKTVVGAEMVSNSALRGNIIWFLNHRRELIRQTSRSFHEQGIPHGTIQAGHVSDRLARVQVASVQTITRKLNDLPPPSFIIADEAHHVASASWARIVDQFPNAKILGLTATPWRLDGTGLGHWFETMAEGPTTEWLIANNRLSPFRLFAPATPNLTGIKTVGGDYERSALASAMDKPIITGDAVAHYKTLCLGKRAVAFCVGIDHSKNVAAQFRDAGISAAHIDGQMSNEERDQVFQAFERGDIHVLCNVDLIGEGVDVPAIECVILLRPTKSLTHYLQSVGRGLRLAPNKSECVILDHAGNSLKHGLPDDVREWSLADREKKSRAAPAEVAIKTCSECFYVFRPAPKCPQCGHVPEVKAREIEQVAGTLAEVTSIPRAKFKKQGKAGSLDDLIRLGRERGYKNPTFWAQKVWASRQGRRAA
jgi:DNA repair protein RadD